MNKEYYNFFWFILKRPNYLLKSFIFYFKIFVEKLINKLKKKQFSNYPERAQWAKVVSELHLSVNVPKEYVLPRLTRTIQLKTSIVDTVATIGMTWKDILKNNQKDEECIFSLNRWYWMIYDQEVLKNITQQEIFELAEFWIKSNPYKEDDKSWESYSVSERITSFTLSLLLKSDFKELQDAIKKKSILLYYFHKSIEHLKNNLEYYPSGITFNHVVNDYKGLLIAALLLGDENLLVKSIETIELELIEIIDEEGFQREGSSHYQCIIAKWICEIIYCLNRSGKSDLAETFKTHWKKVIDMAYFFLDESIKIDSSIPLFGDISPDFNPDWLFFYFKNSLGRQNDESPHYGKDILKNINYRNENSRKTIQSYKEYTKIKNENWLLFIKHSVSHPVYFPSHSHEDWASVIVYFKGIPMIIDAGRQNYLNEPSNDNQCCFKSHNGISINGNSVVLSNIFFYLPNFYKQYSHIVQVKEDEKCLKFSIEGKSIKYIHGYQQQKFVRNIEVNSTSIVIDDVVDGFGKCELTSRFLIHPSWKLEDKSESSIVLSSKDKISDIFIQTDGVIANIEIPQSSKYGNVKNIVQLACEYSGRNRLRGNVLIKILNF